MTDSNRHSAQCKPWEHRLSRRQWLGGAAAGACALGGWTNSSLAAEVKQKSKQVLFIWLDGGMSQFDESSLKVLNMSLIEAVVLGDEEHRPIPEVFFGVMLIQTICLFLTARNLGRGRSHTFCFINACVLCMHAPFGTALGVFTIVVLSRESVKQRFAANQYGYYPPMTMQKF